MERREFLIRTGKAMALAAVSGGIGFVFHNRVSSSYRPPVSLSGDFAVPSETALPALTLARSDDPLRALHAALNAVGGIHRFVQTGQRVTIKPNVGWDRTPQQAANTNPLLVGEMVRLCLAAGASEVTVSDISCNETRRCFLRSGIREAVEANGGRVLLPTDEDLVEVDMHGGVLSTWPVLKPFVDTDCFINMPIVKQHSLTVATVGLKNLYGILGGRRNQLHQQIDQSIVDLASFLRPSLTVVDATRVLTRGGPQGGSLDDVAVENTVMCATDPVAADSRAVEYLGVTGDLVGHIVLADHSGLGRLDYRAAGFREIA